MNDFFKFHGFQLFKGLLATEDLEKPVHAKPIVELASRILLGEVVVGGDKVDSLPAESLARNCSLEVAWCQVRSPLAMIVAPEEIAWICGCPLVIPGSCHGGEMPVGPDGAPIFRRRAYEAIEMRAGDVLVMAQDTIVGLSNNNSGKKVSLWQLKAKLKKKK